jgi:Holliday junction resolvase RusA-like endonuclease
MTPINLTFNSIPISTNCLFRSYRGRVVKSKKYRDWQKDIIDQLSEQYNGDVLECPLELYAVITKSSKRLYDVDNCFKSLLDTLEGICYKNDSQIMRLTGVKSQGDVNRIDVYITEAI